MSQVAGWLSTPVRGRCLVARDCDCCGAQLSLACGDVPDHEGVHMFTCRRCGKDPRC